MERLSLIYESILLSEGRVEKAKDRYPMISDDVFNFYVENDPSGNQKYLDWMLGTTLSDSDTSFRNILEGLFGYHQNMVNFIEFFDNNQQRFEIKDINRYKDLDQLMAAVVEVGKKKEQKRLDKKAKKERDVIYKDDRWLVIVPKSHTASCKYGAGTKWCVTTKDNDTYWNRYTKNSILFFIIDKTKDKSDTKYKVAYRLIGSKGKKYELWDAEDYEFSHVGDEYLESLPGKLRENISIYHAENYEGVYSSNDPRVQAIMNETSSEVVEEIGETYYGLDVFEDENDEYWVAATEDEMEEVIRESYEIYSDTELLVYYDYEGYYLEMCDPESFASEEADYFVDELTDEEVLEYSGMEVEYSLVKDELEKLQNSEDFSGDKEQMLISKMSDIIDESKEKLRQERYDEEMECINKGPVQCLVNEKGWFSTVSELYNSGAVYFDRESLIDYLTDYYDNITPYGWDWSQDNDGGSWIVFEIDY